MRLLPRPLAFAAIAVLVACGTAAAPEQLKPGVDDVTSADGGAPACEIAGIHRQICRRRGADYGDTPEALPFYACFEGATCAATDGNSCGWTMTPARIECLQKSELPPGRIPHADLHVHWDHPEKSLPGIHSPYESLAYIDATGVTSAMLITNTYQAHKTPAMTTDEVIAINRRYSEILVQHPRGAGYRILCGVSFQRDDAVETASRCLALPKVVGFKLRGFTVRRPEDLAKLEALVAVANDRGAIVLAHLGSFDEPAPAEDALAETKKIVTLMDRAPKAKLLIAHAGFGSFLGRAEYAAIGEHYRADPAAVRNIYLETSDSFADYEDGQPRPDAEAWLTSWRAFGIDRVVFGSDYSFKDRWRDDPLTYLATSKVLAPAEAEAILRRTGEALTGSP
jgi:predicted TIM-barrel fold metal-dependent hydrolase